MKKLLLLSLISFSVGFATSDRLPNPFDCGNYSDSYDEPSPYLRDRRELRMGKNIAKGAIEGLKDTFKFTGDFDLGIGRMIEEFKESRERTYRQNIQTKGELHAAKDYISEMTSVGTDFGNQLFDDLVFRNFIKGGLITVGLIGAFLTVKNTVPLIIEQIKRRLNRPKLIIESSKKGLIAKFTSLFKRAQQSLEMVFSPALKKQLDETVKVTTAINNRIKQGKTNVKYRNLMLYGPPGTGKTMFAKELARRSGMEYAFMSGSSFSKFKDGEGIEALDELFAWAKRSKGLMIFIDEAETFLSKRENMDPQSKAYQLLNNFLNYTGERSSQFMLVFATNHQDTLDSAMYRRIDDLIEMPLPSKAQRIAALNLYKNKILMDEKQNGKEFVDSVRSCLGISTLEAIAEKTKGLSYGDLEGIINTIKTDGDIQDPAIITVALIEVVVERAIKKHRVFTHGVLLGAVED